MTKKQRRVDSFFTRTVSPRIDEDATIEEENEEPVRNDENPPSIPVAENATFSTIQRDPGVRQPIWSFPVNKRDEIRRAYLNFGPHRLVLPKYPLTGPKAHPRRFQAKWYSEYPWLEYSRTTDSSTNEHHYHYDIYNETIDFQLRELDSRFNEKIVELLELSSALDPRDGYISFNSDSILKLAKKYYYLDFTDQELDDLEFQLKHFELYMKEHPELGKASSMADLCQRLAYTRKASHYYLVDRLIRLVLTLPVSTASVERAFSAMKTVKNRLRNKMGDEFLSDNLVLYIEKDIAETFSLDSVLDDFCAKKRRVRLK